MSIIKRYPVHYIHNACFTDREAVNKLLISRDDYQIGTGQLPPVPTPKQEQRMFLQMNYYKYIANKIREQYETNPTEQLVEKLQRRDRQIRHVRNIIWAANYRLVLRVMSSTHDKNVNESRVSDGTMTVLRAIEHFNVDMNLKFSTYLTTALRKELWHRAGDDARRSCRYQQFTKEDDDMKVSDRRPVDIAEAKQNFIHQLLKSVKNRLGQQHHDILCHATGIETPKLRYREIVAIYQISQHEVSKIINETMSFLRIAGRYQLQLSEKMA